MSKKYLFIGGFRPFQNPTLGDILTRRAMIGGNCGNLLFINAVVRALMTDEHTEFYPTYYRADFSQAEIEFANETFDGFILPMADAFRDDNIQYLEGLTRFIERLKIPCYVIGVGLRAPYEPDLMKKRKSDSTVFNFVKAVLDHSTMIGVRGEVTGEYLNKLGFKQEKDYTVIGCPSVSVFLNPQISCGGGYWLTDHKIMADRICLITNTLADQTVNQFIINAIGDWDGVDVIAQKEMEQEAIYLGGISGIYKGKFGIPENIFGRELYRSLNKKGRITTFTNLESWKNFVEGANICISSRFHGAVVSMMSAIPTMVIPIDSRMRELCSYHKFATVDKNGLNGAYVEDILENIDFGSWKTVWKENRDHFVSFLDKNGIDHTLAETGECPYDNIARTINWKPPVDNWIALPMRKKIVRAEDYFVGKIHSRSNKNSIIKNGGNV